MISLADLRSLQQGSFWSWFASRAALAGEEDAPALLAELQRALDALAPGALAELEVAPAGRTLIVSAGGRGELVAAVEALVACAPPIDGWRVVALRPRLAARDLRLATGSLEVAGDDVWFLAFEERGRLAVRLFFGGARCLELACEGIEGLVVEHVLGERATIDHVLVLPAGTVEDASARPPLAPLRELAERFDRWRALRRAE